MGDYIPRERKKKPKRHDHHSDLNLLKLFVQQKVRRMISFVPSRRPASSAEWTGLTASHWGDPSYPEPTEKEKKENGGRLFPAAMEDSPSSSTRSERPKLPTAKWGAACAACATAKAKCIRSNLAPGAKCDR